MDSRRANSQRRLVPAMGMVTANKQTLREERMGGASVLITKGTQWSAHPFRPPWGPWCPPCPPCQPCRRPRARFMSDMNFAARATCAMPCLPELVSHPGPGLAHKAKFSKTSRPLLDQTLSFYREIIFWKTLWINVSSVCLLKGLQGNILMDSLMWVGDVDGVLGDEQKSKGGTNRLADDKPLLLAGCLQCSCLLRPDNTDICGIEWPISHTLGLKRYPPFI